MKAADKKLVSETVFKRPDDAHKGTLGSLLSICGCHSMAGAAIMAGKAALRSGIGLLKSAVPESIYPIMAGAIYESVYLPLEQNDGGALSSKNIDRLLCEAEKSSAVLLGCGLSVCDDTRKITAAFVEQCTAPMVLDADALNCIADDLQLLQRAKAPIIITPHPGEMGRLTKSSAAQVNSDREGTATGFAKKYNTVTVLKGAGTITASPGGEAYINTTGNSGMATGGSGDVLAGMTASLLAQGLDAFKAAAAAVYLHGLAGDIAADRLGKISMLPTDLTECIPLAFKECGL